MTMRHVDGPQDAEEEAWAERFEAEQELEMGYRTQQATKPQTLSYAMMDSPVGVAAWIIEKWNSWSDTEGDDIESVYSKDQMLTNIMVYLVTAHLQHRQLDLLRPPRGRRPRAVTGGQARRGADRLRLVSGRDALVAAAQLRRAGLQCDPLDRDAPRRPFRRHGATGFVDKRHPYFRSHLQVGPNLSIAQPVEEAFENTINRMLILT